MKRSVISLLTPFALLISCNSHETHNSMPKSPALPPPPFEAPTNPETKEIDNFSENDLLVGGYAPADIEDESAIKAKEMVIDAIYKKFPTRALVDKVEMQVQVVAGLNYKFRIEMSGPQATRDVFSGAVYRNLKDRFELTSLNQIHGK